MEKRKVERKLILWVFGWRDREMGRMENWWDPVVFSPDPPKFYLFKLGRK